MLPQYRTQANLNVYDSPALDRLATQAAAGRYLVRTQPSAENSDRAIAIKLCEDDYPGWLAADDLSQLVTTTQPYQAPILTETEIQTRLPGAIAFTHQAMAQPNHYLWGGTVAPNYDCSGLMQAAFASVGIWLPRDAYQQEAFAQPRAITDLQPGDLVFFGPPEKATHVGLFLGDGAYIHSSGKDQGRNGIGIDILSDQGDQVSRTYFRQLRGAARIVASYQPQQFHLS